MSTILIIEDNEKNMKLMHDVLQHAGYRTLQAPTGLDGVRLALAERPALILMDIQLPDIDGIEALRRIRADAGSADAAVLAVSASAMPEEQRQIVAAGFDGYLTKPIALKEFIATVRRLLDRGRPA